MAKRNETWSPPVMPVADAIKIVADKSGLASEVVRAVVEMMMVEDAYAAANYKYQNYDLGVHRGKRDGIGIVFKKAGVTWMELATVEFNIEHEQRGDS